MSEIMDLIYNAFENLCMTTNIKELENYFQTSSNILCAVFPDILYIL